MDDRRIWVDANACPVVIKNIKKGAFLSKSDGPLFYILQSWFNLKDSLKISKSLTFCLAIMTQLPLMA